MVIDDNARPIKTLMILILIIFVQCMFINISVSNNVDGIGMVGIIRSVIIGIIRCVDESVGISIHVEKIGRGVDFDVFSLGELACHGLVLDLNLCLIIFQINYL